MQYTTFTLGPVKVNQKIAFFGFEILGLKPIIFLGFEPKFQSFTVWVSALLRTETSQKAQNQVEINKKFFKRTRIYGHLWWPFFSPFGYGKLLELVSICNSLNNSEGMTIFGRNDTNMKGMTIIRKEWQ